MTALCATIASVPVCIKSGSTRVLV